jgi:hypothetical protein
MGLRVRSSSISIGWVCGFILNPSHLAYERCAEGDAEGEQLDVATSMASPSLLPPHTTLPKAVPASQKPGKYKKRPFTYTEDTSEDEDVDMELELNDTSEDEDVDMELELNDTSGSSADSDNIPTKRRRTSTTVTRSSRPTPASKNTTAEPSDCHGSPSPDDDDPNKSETGTATETETEAPSAGVNVSSRVNLTKNITVDTAPTPRHSLAVDMDVDKSGGGSGTNKTTRVGNRCARKSTKTPVAPPQPPQPPSVPDPSPELEIPNFLIGRHNIYGYLSSLEEPGFRALLKSYIAFEVANNANIRGTLSTTKRPTAVQWWISCARPNRLPALTPLDSFTESIVKWWVDLQPHWRKIKPGKILRGKGDWEDLYQPGINGLLNVVVLANWWARALELRDMPVDKMYSWFVSDVAWVLSQLTSAAHEGTFD